MKKLVLALMIITIIFAGVSCAKSGNGSDAQGDSSRFAEKSEIVGVSPEDVGGNSGSDEAVGKITEPANDGKKKDKQSSSTKKNEESSSGTTKQKSAGTTKKTTKKAVTTTKKQTTTKKTTTTTKKTTTTTKKTTTTTKKTTTKGSGSDGSFGTPTVPGDSSYL